jgi:putative transcriptional regulator
MLEGVSEIAPGFLVAVPQLGDPNFQRSVVLMLEHTSEGAIGLVVNRPSQLTLADVARSQSMTASATAKEKPVFVGGPVQTERGFVVHENRELPESVELVDAIHVTSSLDSLQLLMNSAERFRLCLGYAGWGPGQLEQELRDGSWITAKASLEHVLGTPPAEAWEAVLRGMGIDPAMLLHSGGLH